MHEETDSKYAGVWVLSSSVYSMMIGRNQTAVISGESNTRSPAESRQHFAEVPMCPLVYKLHNLDLP